MLKLLSETSPYDYKTKKGFVLNMRFENPMIINSRYRIDKVLFSGCYDLYSGYDMKEKKNICIRKESNNLTYAIESAKVQIQLCALSNVFIKVYDIIYDKKYTYFISELLQGRQVLKIKDLHWKDVLKIMQPVMQAVHIAHQNGILMASEYWPYNIYITNKNEIKLERDLRVRAYNLGTTENSGYLLSNHSPLECYSKKIKDTYTDVYMVAASLYTLITKSTIPSVLFRARGATLDSISKYCPDFPAEKEKAIFKALELVSDNRTQTIADLYVELF